RELRLPPSPTRLPYTTLFRSHAIQALFLARFSGLETPTLRSVLQQVIRHPVVMAIDRDLRPFGVARFDRLQDLFMQPDLGIGVLRTEPLGSPGFVDPGPILLRNQHRMDTLEDRRQVGIAAQSDDLHVQTRVGAYPLGSVVRALAERLERLAREPEVEIVRVLDGFRDP